MGFDSNVVSDSGETVATNLIDLTNPLGNETLEELELILKNGYQPNVIGPSGYPPLHWAIYHNQLAHAEILMKYGADPYLKTNDYLPENAFEVAKSEGNQSALSLLEKFIHQNNKLNL